jgi:hypothetical protein
MTTTPNTYYQDQLELLSDLLTDALSTLEGESGTPRLHIGDALQDAQDLVIRMIAHLNTDPRFKQ